MSTLLHRLPQDDDQPPYWQERELNIEPLDPTLWLGSTVTTGKIVAGLALAAFLWASL